MRNPASLQAIAAAGHELGNHTYSHPHPNTLNKQQNQAQILKAEQTIFEITGVKTKLYAPPYGEFNDTVLAAAGEISYLTILWSIDTVDWKRPSKDAIVKRVVGKLHNGAIILIHPTEPTVKALPELIAEIRQKGYSFCPVSAILPE